MSQETTQELVAVLKSVDASLFDKAKACQRLAAVGTKEAVPALAALLSDEQLAHYARYGLEPNPDPSVEAALRQALGQLEGKLLVGVINSIGQRGDVQAVAGLMKLFAGKDAQVASAAAAALGRIGGLEPARVLREALTTATGKLRCAVADACLVCAEGLAARGRKDAAAALYAAIQQADLAPHQRQAATRGAAVLRGESR